MKLITLTFLITSLAVFIECQRIQQDQYPFPPQFQTPSSGNMVSDSSIYLPPDPQTPIPYFAMNHNMNKLPFQFLPPSGTKAPSVYPTPFSGIFSSTLRPHFDDEDEDDDGQVNQIRISSPRTVMKHNPNLMNKNISELNQEKRALPKMLNFQQPSQNRVEGKHPQSFQQVSTQEPSHPNSASRRMILTSEIQRNDISDHLKSHSSSPYSQLPNIFFSSTTEPAIPILRLSNEMDLDGSFSYEALGADQTHYVQHSRMENMGTDKEEQVVEGSYSYVGDNGQTYTVHYVADSNGYRASGEHLPSPPPIPEIIQRAIQYNLAEEARKPPHMRSSWEEIASENENNVGEKASRFTSTPSRSLFTGRAPEAFSFGFSQNSNSQNNLAATAASSHIPKTNFDIAMELSKPKTNVAPIGPQVTFSASQGAHNPSSSPQQTVSRASPNEKPSMPQIMNYEASAREIDQESKPLWRWQYGMNPNNPEQNPNKNTISRSFGEGDDVIINFNDMTPEQYTDMIRTQVLGQNSNEASEYDNNYFKNNFVQSTSSSLMTDTSNYVYNNINNNANQNNINVEVKNIENNPSFKKEFYAASNEYNTISTTTETSNIMQSFDNYKDEIKIQPKNNPNPYPNIIRQANFIPPSQQVTQSYDYDDTSYEPRKVTVTMDTYLKTNQENINNQQVNIVPSTRYWYTSEETSQSTTIQPHISTISDIKSTMPKFKELNTDFRPIIRSKDSNKQESTTEKNMDELIQENIFLKNIVRNKKEKNITTNTVHKAEVKNNTSSSEVSDDKLSKHVHFYPKPQNEIKTPMKKPLDMTDVLNYIAMKNHFELSKTKPKAKSNLGNYQQNRDTPVKFIPLEEERQESIRDPEERNNSYRTLNQQEEELQGMIKNYKVLQRQRNAAHTSNQYSDIPQKHVKIFHPQGLPPLGRAGPSMKSYLPPSYL